MVITAVIIATQYLVYFQKSYKTYGTSIYYTDIGWYKYYPKQKVSVEKKIEIEIDKKKRPE